MTIATETDRVLYNGDDANTTFPITFTRQVDGDVRVVLRDSSDVETVQVDATDYNIVADDVEMVTAPATGEKLLLIRGTPLLQTTAYPTDGSFPSASHEAALDKLTMEMQMINERVDRGILLKETTTLSELELPEPVASNLLAWNSGATALENITVVSLGVIIMPGTTVVGNIPTFVDTAGGGFKDSGVLIDASQNITGVNSIGIGGIHTPAKLYVLADNAVTFGIYVNLAGVQTSGHPKGLLVTNVSTGSTDGTDKFGAHIISTGNWSGTNAIHYGLAVIAQGGSGTGGINYGIHVAATTGETNYCFYGASGDMFIADNLIVSNITTASGDLVINPAGDDVFIGSGETGSQNSLAIRGAGASNVNGGNLLLHMAADHDGTYDNWSIRPSSEDLIFTQAGGAITLTLAPNGGNATFAGGIITDGTNALKTKIIDIGDWDMDTTTGDGDIAVNVAHGLTLANIRSVDAWIRNDAGTVTYNLQQASIASGNNAGNVDNVDATNVRLERVTGDTFDTTDFDSTSYNRGWITITYTV